MHELIESQFLAVCNALSVRQSQAEPYHRLDAVCSAVPAKCDLLCHGAHRHYDQNCAASPIVLLS